ncbi:TPA: DUF551 domain-containing protein [Klebsiella quasipneumoniae subsp. quasipneumoniae]|uniref:DUF551 domain-containing protein n=1 Tax=Klebsiella pneumoniae complex TaxID=3390273 RepID=UPI000D3CD240|nr:MULTISPECIES: DUF551 domain-containing protein [Klebsiella]PUG99479.1 hypothetical protein DB361_22355 [Klebsiella pneumoniae]HBQ2325082.1 DUF551 domain-containing protein [Klebsiella quasipneumoniae]HCI6033053.1 DUF551 domain-containing protein [Klebsiella quasipneumoniae subsp. quasipneumoniae]
MTSKLTREQLHERARENVKALKLASRQTAFESARKEILADLQLAEIALAAMDSEHHTDDELSNLLWYSQEATCHSDPNYYCEFQRLATPGLIAGIIRELQERRKADSEPVAWLLSGGGTKNVVCFDSGNAYADPLREVTPLYRHPQPAPVVPGKWIPVSERMPEDRKQVILWDAEIGEVTSGHYSHKTQTFYHCGDAIENEITHWMLPPSAPQGVKP